MEDSEIGGIKAHRESGKCIKHSDWKIQRAETARVSGIEGRKILSIFVHAFPFKVNA